ncbi:MAG: pyroglutamyl-peptidase I [Lachnospiraceae bacterium]
MKVLVTGFDPFGGEKVNPAFEAVKLLPDHIEGAEIVKLEIPTVFSRSSKVLEEAIVKYHPDIVISIGQAGGRAEITPEWVAINLAEAKIPDNDGEQPVEETLEEDGPAAYFATIPVKAIAENIRQHGLPCNISYTAGTYVCNSVMYRMLHMAATKYPGIRAGFIHVPYALEQLAGKPSGTPGMTIAAIAKALEYAIEAAVLQ